uniref:BACON domain-containing protein n=1 Tax=Alistipes sp. TaxID=1872444 RepID=UPI0040575A95
MKKIFTLMLALACAMFVGVSCTPDNGGDDSQYAVKITVDQPATFPAEGGEAELNYSLSKEYAGEMVALNTEATASWLTVYLADDGSYKVLLSCLPNNAAGTTPRETSFTLSYKDAKDVTVTVKQNPVAPSFEVAWSNVTPIGATATISVIDTDKQDMLWGAFTFGASMLEQNDGPMPLNATTKTPEEYAAEQLALAADPMGYGGLYMYFYQMAQYGQAAYSEIGNSMNCSLMSMWGGMEKKMYLAVVGINKNVNEQTNEDNSTQSTPIHIFEVEALPQPEVSVSATENVVEATAGTLSLDVTIKNPYGEDDVVTAGGWNVPEWLTVAYENGKVNVTYAENPYAKARTAEFDVTYTYKVMVSMYGETYPQEVPVNATVKVEQKANPNVTPVTFTITVKETHFNKIVVDVVPSDANAYYVLGTDSKSTVNNYAQWGDAWNAVCEYALGGTPLQGTQTNYEFSIDTRYASDESDWTYYVYAFQTDANCTVVAGEPSYVETTITNDAPQTVLKHSALVEKDENEYELVVTGQGGEYSIDFDFVNPVADGKLRFNAYPYTTEDVDTSNGVLGNEGKITIDNENKKITFTVNDYPADWNKTYDPYVNIGFIYGQYVDGAFTSNSYGKSVSLKIVLKKAE